MSFTALVKDEVSKNNYNEMEKISLLSAIVMNGDDLVLSTECNGVARRIYTLFRDVFDIYPSVSVRRGYNYNKKMIYILSINGDHDLIYKKLGIDGNRVCDFIVADDELKRAYLSGVFMMCGSINDPKKSRYHLEFNLGSFEYASFVCNLLNDYFLNSKLLHRDNRYMVYVKEAEKIGDFLRMIGAFNGVMYYEDIRIYRDHKNMTNRLNNCEQANVDRMIETALKQVNDILLIESNGGLDLLGEREKMVALYRLKYREVSLLELSEIISLEEGVKITKSGLYHRFKKISDLANRIRDKLV